MSTHENILLLVSRFVLLCLNRLSERRVILSEFESIQWMK